ncbi:MAG: HAD family acid phosphatase [Candidatus Poseidoniales archaeon]
MFCQVLCCLFWCQLNGVCLCCGSEYCKHDYSFFNHIASQVLIIVHFLGIFVKQILVDILVQIVYNLQHNRIGIKMDIIFDVDGTLMNIAHRRQYVVQRPKDWARFRENTHLDTPYEDVFEVARSLMNSGHRIIIASGRNQSQAEITRQQITSQGVQPVAYYFRSNSDYRPDHVLKSGMLDRMIADGYQPNMVFDDRTSVVEMWRERGLRAVQVAPGDF